MKILPVARGIAIGALLIALFELPDDYYKALRLIVVSVAIFEIWDIQRSSLAQTGKTAWTISFSLLAIVFNPLMPLELGRELWIGVDIVGSLLLAGRFSMRVAILGLIGVTIAAPLVMFVQDQVSLLESEQHFHERLEKALSESRKKFPTVGPDPFGDLANQNNYQHLLNIRSLFINEKDLNTAFRRAEMRDILKRSIDPTSTKCGMANRVLLSFLYDEQAEGDGYEKAKSRYVEEHFGFRKWVGEVDLYILIRRQFLKTFDDSTATPPDVSP